MGVMCAANIFQDQIHNLTFDIECARTYLDTLPVFSGGGIFGAPQQFRESQKTPIF